MCLLNKIDSINKITNPMVRFTRILFFREIIIKVLPLNVEGPVGYFRWSRVGAGLGNNGLKNTDVGPFKQTFCVE